MTMSRRAEWAWIVLACLLLNLTYTATQPVDHFNSAFGAGGRAYQSMAANALQGHPLQEVAPFVYRVGMPLLATGLAETLDWVIRTGFHRLNLGFNVLSVLFLTLLLRRHVDSAFARLVVIVAFLVAPHSPVRLSYFHPVAVDAPVLAGLLAGLLGIDWFRARPCVWRAAALAMFVAVGVAFHEALMVIGVCVLFVPLPGTAPMGWRDRWAAMERSGVWLPLVGGIASLVVIHAWVVATPSDYSASAEVIRWSGDKSLLQYGLAWWLVFGPLLAVPIYYWRRSAAFLGEQLEFLAYLTVFVVAAWIGTGDTERMLVFASPVIYVLVGRALAWAAVGPASAAMITILVAQGLSSRIFSPIGGRDVLAETWDRLGLGIVARGLAYENLWSQTCAPSMIGAYLSWYALVGGSVVGFLWYRGDRLHVPDAKGPGVEGAFPARIGGARSRFASVARGVPPSLVIILGTAAALAPVVWLAFSRFYWNQYAQPGYGYLGYNLARVWTVVVLLAVFWATGSRMIRRAATPGHDPESPSGRFIDAVFCGVATWSVGVVLLAVFHLYYLWVILPLVAVAAGCAVADLVATLRATSHAPDGPPAAPRWGLAGSVLRLIVAFNATALLLTIALWGNPGPDNDVPGNYLPYYEAVMRAHWNGPNDYWVHYFVSKGHGLAFLVNILSDVQGSALASYLMVLLGGVMVWRFAIRRASAAPLIGLVGVCLYLQFYAEQGAYAKGHITRNTLILYLVLSFAHFVAVQGRGAGLALLSRAAVIAAALLLSPLALVLLLPILLLETLLVAMLSSLSEARRYLWLPAWALAVTAAACLYNYFQVGLPELHSMPSVMARFVDVERLSRWLDPGLAYVDDRLAFIQPSLPEGGAGATRVAIAATQSYWQVLPSMWNPATEVLVGGAILIAVLAVVFSRASAGSARSTSRADTGGPALAGAYLTVVLAMLVFLRMFGGGPGSSMARFTDFISPLGIALGVLGLATAWALPMNRVFSGILAVAISGVVCAAIYLGSPPVLAQLWRPSVGFLVGGNTYAAMNDANWDTEAARRLAVSLPAGQRVELINFLPGFTAIPATPFQRPDGSAYLKDYTTVLYGSEEQAAAIYTSANINHFLFDLSGQAPVVFSGFSSIFSPDSIRSRMRLVTHVVSGRGDLYLLTWNRDNAPIDEPFETFLRKWSDLLESEKKAGIYHGPYERGAAAAGPREGR